MSNITREAQSYPRLGQFYDAFNETIAFTTTAGYRYHVQMVGSAASYLGTVSAFLDPVFAFAPGFDASGYQLNDSPGLLAAVPEPASAVLLLLGLAGLGLRRRVSCARRAPAAALPCSSRGARCGR